MATLNFLENAEFSSSWLKKNHFKNSNFAWPDTKNKNSKPTRSMSMKKRVISGDPLGGNNMFIKTLGHTMRHGRKFHRIRGDH